jgi:hypothetical protein
MRPPASASSITRPLPSMKSANRAATASHSSRASPRGIGAELDEPRPGPSDDPGSTSTARPAGSPPAGSSEATCVPPDRAAGRGGRGDTATALGRPGGGTAAVLRAPPPPEPPAGRPRKRPRPSGRGESPPKAPRPAPRRRRGRWPRRPRRDLGDGRLGRIRQERRHRPVLLGQVHPRPARAPRARAAPPPCLPPRWR